MLTNYELFVLEIKVSTSDNLPHRRVYSRINYCFFCERPQSKITRHWESQHGNEREVALILSCSQKSMKEKLVIKLRNHGNHLHNMKVLREGQGTLEVAYRPRPSDVRHHTYYLPCTYCYGYYGKKELWKHARRCLLNDGTTKKKQHVRGARAVLPCPEGITPVMNQIRNSFSDDKISKIALSDHCILALGERLADKHGRDRSKFGTIRNPMREVAKLLQQLRTDEKTPHAQLQDFINPGSFDTIVAAARTVSGFKPQDLSYKTPSLAMKLGHSLAKIADILVGEGLRKRDGTKVEDAEGFLRLYQIDWQNKISFNAHRTLDENKQNQIKLVPLGNDVKLLCKHLRTCMKIQFQALKSSTGDKTAYSALQESTLCYAIIFNRRRSGEVSKMKLSDYYGLHSTDHSAEELRMSVTERRLCQYFKRVEIIGKRGRLVPVLFTPQLTECVDLLVKTRDKVGLKENEYVFARLNFGSRNHIRGSDILRIKSTECGAKRPEALRSTKLRKHIATMTQVYDMKENDQDILAQFLGHDIRVHREFYRRPESTLQTAVVSKMLLAMEQDTLVFGESLDDISVNIDDELLEGW